MGYLYVLLPAGLALASGLELAQAPTPAPGQTALSALDTDRDGSISRSEAQMDPALSARFPELDRNANGALEPAEFARFETLGAESTPGAPSPPRPGGFAPPPLNRVPPPLGTSEPPTGTSPPPMVPTTPPDGESAPPDSNSPPPSPR